MDVEPATIAFALRAGVGLSERLGLFQSAVNRQLTALQSDLQALAEAPLHEGLRRIGYAQTASSSADRLDLLREARGKFDDAAARQLAPLQHGWAVLLLACTWWLLDARDLARRAGKEAWLAAEVAWSDAEMEMWNHQGPFTPFREQSPDPTWKAAKALAAAAVQVNLAMGFPFLGEMRDDDEEPFFYLDLGEEDDCLVLIELEFVAEQRPLV